MIAIFESILPIFLVLLAGNVLRRLPKFDAEVWPALDQLGYWVLYPALLFVTIANADFTGLQLDAMMAALLVSVCVMCAFTYSLWPLLSGSGRLVESEFSTVFQTTVRWNSFIALAVAQKLYPPAGMAVVALVMLVIIIPLNIASTFVVTRFADRSANWQRVMRNLATNPFILAMLAAMVLRSLPFGLYPPLSDALDLVGRSALGIGLLAIGASLRTRDLVQLRFAMWLPTVLKLVAFPALLVATAMAFGVTGMQLSYLALCGAVPTAMNGYLLARQLGGDAELYAAVTTLQTAVSFLTIPAVLAITGQLSAG
ncbi:AEC family transporter [Mesorhizobium sp. NBSH29]|uniref:AEC family transporter n=1 Tax=Mesorhizobium sp. NBSH29 TaxID=2654249 RepID=UPI001896965B|nr:AEC family transporter [Mesorhizobium sp. NBSH29]QPC87627.1 AEC family transporter [Mesorhizobium sp. NBSH29]